MTIDEMITVLQAAKAGKKIQFRCQWPVNENWKEYRGPLPSFNFANYDFRVKPEPREWWLCNGYDKTTWMVVNADHGHSPLTCPGEKVKVREVLE